MFALQSKKKKKHTRRSRLCRVLKDYTRQTCKKKKIAHGKRIEIRSGSIDPLSQHAPVRSGDCFPDRPPATAPSPPPRSTRRRPHLRPDPPGPDPPRSAPPLPAPSSAVPLLPCSAPLRLALRPDRSPLFRHRAAAHSLPSRRLPSSPPARRRRSRRSETSRRRRPRQRDGGRELSRDSKRALLPPTIPPPRRAGRSCNDGDPPDVADRDLQWTSLLPLPEGEKDQGPEASAGDGGSPTVAEGQLSRSCCTTPRSISVSYRGC